MADWATGTIIDQRFEIREFIGRGGWGEVHVVHDRVLDQLMAMKTPRQECLSHPVFAKLLDQEHEIMISVNRYDNFVRAYFIRYLVGRPCLFMEYVDGGNLRSLIGRVNLNLSLPILIQVCSGMTHLHMNRGITHRDLKPENILVNRQGLVKITDFGFSDFFTPELRGGRETDSEAESRIMGGTYPYMPPEQWVGDPSGPWSDIYSFGIIMYEMLTGNVPFRGYSPDEWKQLHVRAKPQRPSTLNGPIPRDLEELVIHCLEKDAAKRPVNFLKIWPILENLYRQIFGMDFRHPDENLSQGSVSKTEGNWEALLELGVVAYRWGRTKEALQNFQSAVKLNPSSFDCWFYLGNAAAKLADHNTAIKAFRRCCNLSPTESKPHANMANSYLALGDTASALTEYEEALRLDPTDRVAKVNFTALRHLRKT